MLDLQYIYKTVCLLYKLEAIKEACSTTPRCVKCHVQVWVDTFEINPHDTASILGQCGQELLGEKFLPVYCCAGGGTAATDRGCFCNLKATLRTLPQLWALIRRNDIGFTRSSFCLRSTVLSLEALLLAAQKQLSGQGHPFPAPPLVHCIFCSASVFGYPEAGLHRHR